MKTCNRCHSEFSPAHGNQQYCSSKCKSLQKAETQKKLYGIIKDFRMGFLKNYKIFEAIMNGERQKTLPLHYLEKLGFNYNCFYADFEDTQGSIWNIVAEYRFCIKVNCKSETQVTITKI